MINYSSLVAYSKDKAFIHREFSKHMEELQRIRPCGLIYIPSKIRRKFQNCRFTVYEENGKIIVSPFEINDPRLENALKLQVFRGNGDIYIPRSLYRKFKDCMFSVLDEGDRIVLDPIKIEQ